MIIVQTQGQIVELPQISELVQKLVAQWANVQPDVALKWWQVWSKQVNFKKSTKFLIDCVDDFIHLVEQYIPRGADKKETCLAEMAMLFDFIVANTLPVYLKPFAGKIKNAVIFVIVSELIDFMVGKYREGAWQSLPAPVVPAPEETHVEEKTEGGGQLSGGADAAVS